MRLLILSQLYFPEPDYIVHGLARDLVARGHQVTTVTVVPNYPYGRFYSGYGFRMWPQIETIDGVRVIRVPSFPDHSTSVMRRVTCYLSYVVSASLFAPLLSGSADLVWCFHSPMTVAFPGLFVARLKGIPFIYGLQDLWPDTLEATGFVRSRLALQLVGLSAQVIYRCAAKVFVPSPGIARALQNRGVPAEKLEVLPNWADEAVYRPAQREPDAKEPWDVAGGFNILYAGNLGLAQDLHNAIEAMAALRACPDVRLVIAGDGVTGPSLRARATALGLTNVVFLGRVPPERIVALAAYCDALLVHLGPHPLFEITTPSKLVSSMACGRPLIVVARGDAAAVVDSARAGFACAPDNPNALAEAILTLKNTPLEAREQFGKSAHQYFLSNFTRKHVVSRYDFLFKALVLHPA